MGVLIITLLGCLSFSIGVAQEQCRPKAPWSLGEVLLPELWSSLIIAEFKRQSMMEKERDR